MPSGNSDARRGRDAAPSQRGVGWVAGVSPALPTAAGAVPIGLSLGVLAHQAALAAPAALLMSPIAYAGASQMIATGLMMTGPPVHSIVLKTFAVNLRHLVLTSSLARLLSGWDRVAAGCLRLPHHRRDTHGTLVAVCGRPDRSGCGMRDECDPARRLFGGLRTWRGRRHCDSRRAQTRIGLRLSRHFHRASGTAGRQSGAGPRGTDRLGGSATLVSGRGRPLNDAHRRRRCGHGRALAGGHARTAQH
jgi:hypothetical protein